MTDRCPRGHFLAANWWQRVFLCNIGGHRDYAVGHCRVCANDWHARSHFFGKLKGNVGT